MGVRGSTDELNPSRTPRAFVAGLFDGEHPGVEDLVVTPDWVATEIHIDGRAVHAVVMDGSLTPAHARHAGAAAGSRAGGRGP